MGIKSNCEILFYVKRSLASFDFIVVGAGFFGLTIAHKIATELCKKVVVIEKRDHIGGNSHSEKYGNSDIEVHKYGSHLFHTSSLEVWQFINQFSSFNTYLHQVKSLYKGQFFDIPINLHTLSQFFSRPFSPSDAKEFLDNQKNYFPDRKALTFEDRAIQTVGTDLYEAFYRGYTKKQWHLDPSLLPAETFSRIPVRLNFDSRYFDDTYQGLPTLGYSNVFKKMVEHSNIEILTGIDFFELEFQRGEEQLVIFTGPIDRYFSYRFGMLNWRTLDFEWSMKDTNDFQGNAVINYPEEGFTFTRIHEFKHLHPERAEIINSNQTVIAKEFSRFAEIGDEPFYPVNSSQDKIVLRQYRELVNREKGVFFGGRLGRYQYLDMHMAIAAALRLFDEIRVL